MEQLSGLGRAIHEVVQPTFGLYAPLLQANADRIKSVSRKTFKYGPHERHELDVYYPSEPKFINGRQAILLFEYGGGFVQGDKQVALLPGGLLYGNLGAFFALSAGYTVVIADYRLIRHNAKFPSGGEDIALAVEWIAEKGVSQGGLANEAIDLFIMGNSAGGVHLSTFLLHPDFAQARRKITRGHDTRLRGVIMLSVPFNFTSTYKGRAETLESYFGDIHANSPHGLLQTVRAGGSAPDFLTGGTRVLVLSGELDPEDEILQPRDDFVKEWLQMTDFDSKTALAIDSMPGHNHISPALGLGTGVEVEEAWGYQVAAFCDNVRKFAPR